jgi:hypothetical protein
MSHESGSFLGSRDESSSTRRIINAYFNDLVYPIFDITGEGRRNIIRNGDIQGFCKVLEALNERPTASSSLSHLQCVSFVDATSRSLGWSLLDWLAHR